MIHMRSLTFFTSSDSWTANSFGWGRRCLLLFLILASMPMLVFADDQGAGKELPHSQAEFWSLVRSSKDPSLASLDELQHWIQAHSSDRQACFMKGVLGRLGYIPTQSTDEWLAPIREAATGGYAPAQGLLGMILLQGDSTPSDADAALSWMEKGTAQNDGLSYLAEAGLYRIGTASIPRDDRKAKLLFQKAEAQGYLLAKVGMLTLSSDHGDATAAFSAMKKLAEEGVPSAMAYAGAWCIYGKGTTQDLARGFKWIASAAAANNPSDPMYIAGLGTLYYYGIGVNPDQAKGIQLLEQAYLGRSHDAGLTLARILFTDAKKKDASKASGILRELSKLFDSNAQLELGRRMVVGDGVEKQTVAGTKLLESSARSGNEDALAILSAVEPTFAESLMHDKRLTAEFTIGNWGDPLIIPVWHNDALACFLLDTGAEMSILDEKSFSGLKSTGGSHAVQMHGGLENHELFVAPHFNVGPFDLADSDTVLCFDLSNYQTAVRLPLIGILGGPAIRRSVLQIDYDQHKFRFMHSDDLAHEEWGNRTDMATRSDAPEIQVTFGGVKLPFVLDTGLQNDGSLIEE